MGVALCWALLCDGCCTVLGAAVACVLRCAGRCCAMGVALCWALLSRVCCAGRCALLCDGCCSVEFPVSRELLGLVIGVKGARVKQVPTSGGCCRAVVAAAVAAAIGAIVAVG